MAMGTVLSAAQTLFAALQCFELKEMCSIFGYESQLNDLQRTVSTVRAVLRDAESKQDDLSHEAQLWIQELKEVVYDADDLLDEFVTLSVQKQLHSKKLHSFFYRHNPLGFARKMYQGVTKIQKKLDAIAKDHTQFGFSIDPQPVRKRREETCSYVYEGNIIGREDDLEKIVGLLTDSNIQQDVSFLTIVGIGGLGKTALAQLVYNDPRVTSAFPLKKWVCVSDHDQVQLDIEGILRKILASATGQDYGGSPIDWLQAQFREKITSRKYLLVLDDVWTENRNQWLKLVEFFLGGQRGSWIVVSSRSHETARIVGGASTHELQGLSKENSWLLFKKIAFGSEQPNPLDDNMVKIGKEIVEGCARVPLAIRVAGSLLYGQDISKWLAFQEIGLCNFKERQNDIMPILKLSYHQLASPLKSCFTYCALFPKDFLIEKQMLINLWMAQGYVVALDEGQKIEDAAEEYFSILLRRCFFQDVEFDRDGGIFAVKIHDLMHDIAQNVAGKEICVNLVPGDKDIKVRHLFHKSEYVRYFFSKTYIRTYFRPFVYRGIQLDQSYWEALLANWMCLRALDLRGSGIKSLPESIGELLHLRYLNLTGNRDLEVLPKSVTKLYNMQTLILRGCNSLKGLPKDLMKLVNLRILDIHGGNAVTNMPRGMSKLIRLQMLSWFVLNTSRKQWFDQLGELGLLNNLKGELYIKILRENATRVNEVGRRGGAYLRSKEHLRQIHISFSGHGNADEANRLMEELQPHPNLKELKLFGCFDQMPSWARENSLLTSLPYLVELQLISCRIRYLTCLGNLYHLKTLRIILCQYLEYIIEESAFAATSEPVASTPVGLSSAQGFSLFPSLVTLSLIGLPMLKGWRRLQLGMGDINQLLDDTSTSGKACNMEESPFLQLRTLSIQGCPNLISILSCPNLEELSLMDFNKRLQIITQGKLSQGGTAEASSSSTSNHPCSSSSSYGIPKLRDLEIDNVAWLYSLPMEDFQCLVQLRIKQDIEVKSLGEVREVIRSCSSSLQSLVIEGCPNLRSGLSGELEHLTALETLTIEKCPNLSLSMEKGIEHGIGMPCHHSLRCLKLYYLPQLLHLPSWIEFLAALKFLEIQQCGGLESLPDWMPKLTSLRGLYILGCSEHLEERCKPSSGEDWPHIQHIPSVSIKRGVLDYHGIRASVAISSHLDSVFGETLRILHYPRLESLDVQTHKP